ncbi:ArgK/MeaB family GTPase [Roseibium litorale]|uniref:Methylmalonyl Co-A mutase-associated GTPase MeaB n=1 Tax=Roseibium litorale TaxID=2803841 RepID=A0ABR9CHK2_9HYPH|nr:methylmalonyl Co-A mutase-associated GTPase MeaB [Roseibium litorale]MBD8890310.1 methylmalonyl Co-A mutase-associated GTPase MeaB [Roseibium litorale]
MVGPAPDLEAIRRGGKLVLSRMLTRLEVAAADPEIAAFLDKACAEDKGHVLGLTGPPGVGKSTLTDALIRQARSSGKTVSVLAIDPSSRLTHGALLGDRTRLTTDPDDQGIFVRSMAARDRLGGLSDQAIAAIALLRAVTDLVIVESVGIGQSEGDLVQACDTLVLCIQPGSGDSLQFMKAGIMELPDIAAVTKADTGAMARRAASDAAGALSLGQGNTSGWKVPVCEISARTGQGIEALMTEVARHQAYLRHSGKLAAKRAAQQAGWLDDMIRIRFGTAGLALVRSGAAGLLAAQAPFSSYLSLARRLDVALQRF